MLENLEGEIWKPVKGYEDRYEISNKGRFKGLEMKVKFCRKLEERLIAIMIDKYGYSRVGLNRNSKKKYVLVSRLVAIHFLPNPNNYPQVNHKKEFEKQNNEVDNLEWCTAKYNNNYGTVSKRIGLKLSKAVNQYTLEGEFIKWWVSATECERNTEFKHEGISKCCRGKAKQHKECRWKFDS